MRVIIAGVVEDGHGIQVDTHVRSSLVVNLTLCYLFARWRWICSLESPSPIVAVPMLWLKVHPTCQGSPQHRTS